MATKPKKKRPGAPKKPKELKKGESMRIRINATDKAILAEAAARVGLSVSAFMLSAALEKAHAALGK